jgi:ABC-type nitrate/sulfonate/bicarbonate transport system ATPase subunit/ABC-type nitrate/sulfonate/bicarbonate transport system permease component
VRRGTGRAFLFFLIGVGLLVSIWTALSYYAGFSIIPPPWGVLLATARLLALTHTWVQILITLSRVAAGFVLAFVSGTIIGIATGRNTALESVFKPVIQFLQGIPPLLWAIPLILLFGIGSLSPILMIAFICLPLVVLNVAQGVKSVPPELEEMMGVFAPGVYPRIRELLLPHLRPFFSASLKLGVSLGIKASVIGEYFGANNGVGFQIQAAYQSLQTRELAAWGILLVALILLSSHLLTLGERSRRPVPVGSAKPRPRAIRPGAVVRSAPAPVGAIELLLQGKTEKLELALSDVCFSYRDHSGSDENALLRNINLRVPAGTVAVIRGESGVGKTTLLKIAAGILTPDSGEVKRPGRVGIVFQDDRLLGWKTILRNLAIPLVYQGCPYKKASAWAASLMSEFGLKGWEQSLPDELSGGMKKRATLARCFMRKPLLILLDEPMSGLHREARAYLWERFFSLLMHSRVPAVIVTHFPEEIAHFPNLHSYSLGGKPARLERV